MCVYDCNNNIISIWILLLLYLEKTAGVSAMYLRAGTGVKSAQWRVCTHAFPAE
jgi:hypothetical protein